MIDNKRQDDEPNELPWDHVIEDADTLPLFENDEEDSLAANYLADDCTVRCGLCDSRVDDDGRCPHCDGPKHIAEDDEDFER